MRIGQRVLFAFASLTLPALAAVNGCVSDDTAAPAASDDAGPLYDGAPIVNGDAGPGVDATPAVDGNVNDANPTDGNPIEDTNPPVDAGPPPAQLRVAWFDDPSYVNQVAQIRAPFGSPKPQTSAPKFDACISPHGANQWQGPLLAKAGSPGLSLYDVSAYFPVPPGQYDVRLVFVPSTGTATCDLVNAGADAAPQTTDFTDLPAVASNAHLTAVVTPVYGSLTPGSVSLIPLVDEPTVTAGKTKVRFANVSAQPLMDYGLGGGDVFTPLFTNVPNTGITQADADAGTNAGVDTNGYVEVAPFAQIDTTMGSDGTDQGVSPPINAPAGTILSAFAVTVVVPGNESISSLIVCDDVHANASAPLLSNCTSATYVDPTAPVHDVVRFANFIDGQAGGIDFCIKYHSMPSYGPHSIGTEVLGSPYGSASERYNLHAGFVYDVRVVAGGAADCTQALTPDVMLTTPNGPTALTTMAFTGTIVDGGAVAIDAGADSGGLTTTAFAALTFSDSQCVGTETAPVIRVINVADEVAGPQTAVLNGGDSWSITNVPYGAVASPTGVDACGYLGVTAASGNLQTTNGAWFYSNSSQTETLYLFSTGPVVSVLACDDNDPSDAACVVLGSDG